MVQVCVGNDGWLPGKIVSLGYKGYGFVRVESGRDCFLPVEAVHCSGYSWESFSTGDLVEIQLCDDRNRRVARIRLVISPVARVLVLLDSLKDKGIPPH